MIRDVAKPGRAHLEDLIHVEPDVIVCQGLVQLLYATTKSLGFLCLCLSVNRQHTFMEQ